MLKISHRSAETVKSKENQFKFAQMTLVAQTGTKMKFPINQVTCSADAVDGFVEFSTSGKTQIDRDGSSTCGDKQEQFWTRRWKVVLKVSCRVRLQK